jgi:hypothetical protein
MFLLPSLSVWLPGEGFHRLIALAIVVFSLPVFVMSYRRYGTKRPLILGISGIAVLWSALIFPTHQQKILETGLTTIGSCFLVAAHVLNLRFRWQACCQSASSM